MPKIATRPLGRSDISVPVMSLGSWHTWDRVPFEEVAQVLRYAVDVGAAFFDVGVYRGMSPDMPDSPTDIIFSRAIQAAGVSRADYVLSVKNWVFEPPTPEGIEAQHDAALYRIGTDHADILVFGDVLGRTPEYDAIAAGAGRVLAAGKARAWGVNNWSAAEVNTLAAAAREQGVAEPSMVQQKYNIARRSVVEGEPFRRLASEVGVSIQASDAVEGGVLLGKVPNRMTAGDIGSIRGQIKAAQPQLQAAANALGCTVAQFVLAYLLTNENLATVLIGSRTLEQTRENLGAVEVFERVDADALREAAAPFWFDAGKVDPTASWGTKPGDDPSVYTVILPD